MACQQLRLKIGDKAERRVFLQEVVAALFLLALLPRGQHRLAAVVGQQNCAAFASLKIGGASAGAG